jgi:hypothetical protein
MTDDAKTRSDRINSEMLDSFDEELELEIDDDRLARLLNEASEHPEPGTLDRRVYFKELFRLQGELVKLQDWSCTKNSRLSSCSRGATRPARAGSSSASPSASTRGSAGSPRYRLPMSANAPSGISSATWRIFRPAGKSCCSTAVGIIAPA